MEEDPSTIEVLKIQLDQKIWNSKKLVNRVDSIYGGISPPLIKSSGFNLILCNKRYFNILSKDEYISNLIAWGLVDIPFYVYMIKPNNKDGSNPEKNEVLARLKYCQFKKYGAIVGRVDNEILNCIIDVLKYYNQIL